MKTFKRRSLSLVFALASVLLLVVAPLTGMADAATSTNKSNSMMVSPLRTDITVAPGHSTVVEINITNLTKASLTLDPIENDFIAGANEDGTPALILDKDKSAPTHSLKQFMIPLKQFTLAAGKTKTERLTIDVPPTAQAGGYFGALRFMPASEDNSKNVALNSSVASLVILTVPGSTVHKLVLTDFKVQQDGHSTGFFDNFSSANNLKLFMRFENDGNAQEAPFGQVNVTKGSKVAYTYNFNDGDPKELVLPDSARRWNIPLKNLGNFGKYTVSGTFSYGNGHSIQIDQSFWIIPSILIIGVVVAIIVILLLIFGIRAFLKSYKRRILRGRRR